METDIRQSIYLAALLHDIGKFWQRASDRDETLSASTRNIAGDLQPSYDGRLSHKHVLWTSEFFEKFQNILPQVCHHEGGAVQIGHLSARHHRQSLSDLERVIAFADKLSSGHDREQSPEEQAEIERRDFSRFKKVRLQNIFDQLFRSIRETHHSLAPLSLDKSVFASQKEAQDEQAAEEYKKLWEQFEEEVHHLPTGSFSALATSLLSLLRKYTWCIPSSTIDQPDVSLYDHLKTTAALAVCLFDSLEEHPPLPSHIDGLKMEEAERFSLIGGDFSGIQNFIYQITSKAAAKTLKGRSFYLQLIQDMVIEKIKMIYAVEDAHVLFASGGRFYLLVPNLQERWNRVVSTIDKVNKEMLERFDGMLYLAVGKVDFAAPALFKGYQTLVDRVQASIEKEKSHRFARHLGSDIDFFEPGELKGLTADDVCKVTGVDLYPDEELIPPEKRNRATGNVWKEEGSISKVAEDQIRLGMKLRNARWLVRYKRSAKKEEFEPLEGGISYRFFNREELRPEWIEGADRITAINDVDGFLKPARHTDPFGYEFQFYGAAWTPTDEEGSVLEFEDIACDERVNALGLIRMDVDNLGIAFREGFVQEGENRNIASISRVTTLSSRIEWFFSGYLNHLLTTRFQPGGSQLVIQPDGNSSEGYDYRRHLYPVYAGGDDLFLVTRWDLAPMLAGQIYQDFREFTNHNPKMTISCGIAVIQPRTPVHKGANEAGYAESRSKSLAPVGKKNAITFLNYTCDWDDFALICELATEFKQLVGGMNSRALIGLLRDTSSDYLHLKQRKEEGKWSGDPLYGRWRWRAAYQLTRLKKMYGGSSSYLDVEGVGGELFLTGTYKKRRLRRPVETDLVESLPMLTRWLTLLTRTTRKNHHV